MTEHILRVNHKHVKFASFLRYITRHNHLLLFLVAICTSMLDSVVFAQPLQVGTAKQVFIDTRFIADARNVELVVNRPRVTGEKLIVPDKPWEDFYIGAYTTVIQEGDRIHMWYLTADQRELKDLNAVAYAYSIDGGATWTKPDLGIIEYESSTSNNLVLTGVHGATVFRNRPDAPPNEKYCMFVAQTKGDKPNEYPSMALYSADGLHWRAIEKVPFLDVSGLSKYHYFHLDSQNVTYWDRRLEKYVMMLRINDGDTRTVGRTESKIFGDFPTPQIVFRPDENDLSNMDFYTSAAIQYPWAADAYYMFPAAYYITSMQKNDGPIDIQFAASRDGLNWLRPDRRAIIRLGFEGQWDKGALYAGYGLSRQGDELSLYYSGYDVTHGAYVDRGYLGGTITRAIYRLDGFMSIDASYEKGGEFVTPVMVFGGDRLEINFDGSAGGWASVEIQDEDGKSISGFTEKDCDKISGNSVRKQVTWKGKTSVSSLKGKQVKLRFVMRDAKLYAFQFVGTDKPSGAINYERIGTDVIYDYDPSTKVGDNVFGTIICDFANEAPGRCSHGGPVCLEYPNGDIVAFHTNTSGHNIDGWSEYAVSSDSGRTWDKNNKFKYSYDIYQKDPKSPAWVQEGLVTEKGAVVLFVTHFVDNDSVRKTGFMRSKDNGVTWSDYEYVGLGHANAVAVSGDTSYVQFGNLYHGSHVLYASTDDGRSWQERSTLSLGKEKWYGGMCVMGDGRLLACAYDHNDEHHLYYCISKDKGYTWGEQKKTYMDMKIRDPELAYLTGTYYLFGRSGHSGPGSHRFVMYQSEDGENWKNGVVISDDTQGPDGYNNNCIINQYQEDVPNELMVEYSICYADSITNEYVFFIKPGDM